MLCIALENFFGINVQLLNIEKHMSSLLSSGNDTGRPGVRILDWELSIFNIIYEIKTVFLCDIRDIHINIQLKLKY